MHRSPTTGLAWRRLASALFIGALAAACGGGHSDPPASPVSCSLDDQVDWLQQQVAYWNWWPAPTPLPDPIGDGQAETYFRALLYPGGSAGLPADRYSRSFSTADHDRYFRDGTAMGYGVHLMDLETAGRPDASLYVRYIDPDSPAGRNSGIWRGARLIALDGNDVRYNPEQLKRLSPTQPGQSVTLTLIPVGRAMSYVLTAEVYPLRPVDAVQVLRAADGHAVGYLLLTDLVTQSMAPLEAAFARFKAEGVTDLVLDMRYAGDGVLEAAALLASEVAGDRARGRVFARLRHSAARAAAHDRDVPFTQPAAGLGLSRVVVITGRRTCGVAEQVITGLRGVGIEVVTVGETTCGQPVGTVALQGCGRTYRLVSHERLDDRGTGRYFDGLAPTCPFVDQPYCYCFPLGNEFEPVLRASMQFINTARCPSGS